MKNVYFVQVCDLHGDGKSASAYLPYASGLLAAYFLDDPQTAANYRVGRFIYKKENISACIDSMQAPAVVGFSTYVWNYEYNKRFARELKKRYPDCTVIFGGHHILNDSSEQLDSFPFIDFLIHGEGEIAFHDILLHLITDNDFSSVPNISYRDDNGKAIKNPARKICTLSYPSPYLTGLFEDVLKDKDISFSALLETNRGCPFKCAYCDWGSITQQMRSFPMERVIEEMRWFSEHKIDFCFCIDSNFGLFPRDYDIVDAFLKIKNETGYPQAFKCCTTEGTGKSAFNINRKLNDSGIIKGASLAMQTLSPEALRNIGRKNISLEQYGAMTAQYNEAGIPTYSELIYGLPGETYDSFSQNLCYMLESGTTMGCFIHYCELLPNSALALKENVERFKIKTAKIPYTQFHSETVHEVEEYSNIIISNYSMDYDMWIDTVIFGLFVQCFHFMGLLQCVAKYLFYEKNISYRYFYENVIKWAKANPETVMGKYYALMYNKLSALKRGEVISRSYVNPVFGNIDYPLEEGMCLETVTHLDVFFDQIKDFISPLVANDALTEELIEYQKLIIRNHEDSEKSKSFDYDFFKFYHNINIGMPQPLQKKKNTLNLKNKYGKTDLIDFAVNIVWYGRKGARIIYHPDEIEQIFQ